MALIEGCKHALEITIPVADVAQETERVVEKVRARARLKGFRPGKAPAALIRTQYAGEVRQEVLEALIPAAIEKACEKESLRLISRPDVKDLHFHDGEDVHFVAEFEVAPEFELKEVRGLEVEYAEPAVADEDIDKRLAELRERKAEFVNIEPRAAADGDHALIAMESLSGVEGPALKQDDVNVEIAGADTFPAFTEALRGAEAGDVREADVTYPDDYGVERLAGKTVRFRITLKALRTKELPELNDEFAKDLGDFQNLAELKEEIRKGMFHEREYLAQTQAKNTLVDKLVDQHDFPVPEAYVERQLESIIEGQLHTLASQGVDISKIKLDWGVIKKNQRDRAVREVKASLLLDKLATQESIEPTMEEVDREVQRIAREEREPVAATRMRLEKDGSLRRIATRIRTEKTLGFLFENARKSAPPAPAPAE